MGAKEVYGREFIPGCIVVLDLDKFEEMTEQKGFDEYKRNIITGTLTRLVEDIAIKNKGITIYGLDYERGTEEAVLEFPGLSSEELMDDLEKILREINKLGASITIVALNGLVAGKKANKRKDAFYGTPWRTTATKILRKAKRKGGNTIIIL